MKYDIMDCIINHNDNVKFDHRGVPKECKQCEKKDQPQTARKSKKARIREFQELVRF